MLDFAPMAPVVAMLALAAMVSPRLLGVPDPGIEGSFALAAAVTSILISRGAAAWLPIGVVAAALAPGLLAWLARRASGWPLWMCGGVVSAVCLLALRGFGMVYDAPGWSGVDAAVALAAGCVLLVVMSAVWVWLVRGRVGLGIRAVGLGGDAVRYRIVPAWAARVVVLAAGGVFAGIAGVLFAVAPRGSAALVPAGAWFTGMAAAGMGRLVGRFVKASGAVDVVSAVVGSALWCSLVAAISAAASAGVF
ncbi:MAG: hypothetical protein LBS11_09765 [Oscillospiraceae bacterium]|nr:hypothetical protein [Oscillospiraceae bacterium]